MDSTAVIKNYLSPPSLSRQYLCSHDEATGQAERKIGYDPLAPDSCTSPPYPYRRHEKLTVEEHGDYAAQMLEDTIIYEGVETVAAFIMEPMISGGGVIVPPDNYIAKIRQICDRYGVVLIFDEVVSGFGRTGKLFGHWHWGIKPDIITFAKGISSGYMPLSATVVSNRIFEAFYGEANELKHFRHVNTYSAHPASTAVGLPTLEIMLREDLPDNAMRMGAYIREGLKELEDHPMWEKFVVRVSYLALKRWRIHITQKSL
ncbi:MAG: aminotransferase class III-fold pyridoxal phosphate-dependent enzyme [Deinococcales bacterium]